MLIQRDRLVSQLADQQVLFLDFLLKGQRPFQLLLGGLESRLRCGGGLFRGLYLLAKLLRLGLMRLDHVAEFRLALCDDY